jgi:hypothetical protein
MKPASLAMNRQVPLYSQPHIISFYLPYNHFMFLDCFLSLSLDCLLYLQDYPATDDSESVIDLSTDYSLFRTSDLRLIVCSIHALHLTHLSLLWAPY